MDDGFYGIAVHRIDGSETTLAEYRERVLLVVNVASRCGFTPQYAGLETLWREYGARGLVVLGFPCNQFGAQEPGSNEEILQFCSTSYDVSFPLFARIEVNGDGAHPLYRYLKAHAPGVLGSEVIKWNFTKFLVSRRGAVLDRFAPTTPPETLREPIEAAL